MIESLPARALIDTNPSQVVDFLDGCSIVRESLGSHKLHDAQLLLPLRGAMPLFWAASGDSAIEDPLEQAIVELPIGLYHWNRLDGADKTTSPNGNEKHRIISSIMDSIYDGQEDMKICLLDEVQKGGTITLAASLTRNCMMRLGINPPLHVLAAQDSRTRVVREQKTRQYEIMASNGISNIDANVIAMPLIATDKDALLDSIYLSEPTNTAETMQFTVERNIRAEKLIRGISTMSRCALVRYDESYIRDLFDQTGGNLLDESHSARLEVWIEKFINDSKPSIDRPRPCDIRP